jgi:PAS domain S-box-containing protein
MVDFIESQHYRQILDALSREYIISKTDPKGIITYVNDLFCEISGYTREELIGKPHNKVRHPDMPRETFKDLWNTIKTEKRPWTGFIKNKRKDGSYYWVSSTIFPIFSADDPAEIEGFLSLRKEITHIMDDYETNEINSKLFSIKEYASKNHDKGLKEILNFALDEVLKFKWLEVLKKGGIMLWDEETQRLKMFVHRGVGESLLKMCDRVELNRCLCGKAAALKELVFKSHVDDDHENRPAGITPHGHYNVPLMFHNQLLGVMFLYVQDGYTKREIEAEFFRHLGNVLGSIIYRYKLEDDLKQTNLNNFLFLQHLKRFSSRDTYSFSKNLILQSGDEVDLSKKQFYTERYLNLLILDIVNFTGFSENRSPLEVRNAVSDLFSQFVNAIHEHRGDIDKFVGDSIFSYFEHPEDALKAAVQIIEICNDPVRNPQGFKIRTGIHSGNVIHAEVGNEIRSDYTLMGDTVNTTQRIQQASKENQILVSETFLNQLTPEEMAEYAISKRHLLKSKNKQNLIPVYWIHSRKHTGNGKAPSEIVYSRPHAVS